VRVGIGWEGLVPDRILETVSEIVARIAGPNRTPEVVAPATRLTEDYWLGSVELLEVVIACENAFDIVFDPEQDVEAHAFETLGSLADTVRCKLEERDR
jgi:acyl carrier protein